MQFYFLCIYMLLYELKCWLNISEIKNKSGSSVANLFIVERKHVFHKLQMALEKACYF